MYTKTNAVGTHIEYSTPTNNGTFVTGVKRLIGERQYACCHIIDANVSLQNDNCNIDGVICFRPFIHGNPLHFPDLSVFGFK